MKKLTAFVVSAALFSLISSSLFSAGYLKIGHIKGETIDKSNASEVGPIRWMAPESINNKRAAAGGTVTLTKRIDKSSPLLAKSHNSGGEIGEMALAEDGKQFLLKNVKVVSIKKKGRQELVTLRFQHREEFGQTRANHNTTRSNRLAPASGGATDYNSSRSNKRG
ncbi:type VI secretion system tube protein Hcp [Opitutia bacterium ISCC 51]|nr:type VI secretion system tube protein Hcp [Opitutae bacterium ISCC 51]QXD27997.1 type VI secretion system tube protein Hcp [Opitutae bacterium ISCC 52]